MNILIIYSTSDGHTKKICDHITSSILKTNNLVTLKSINEVTRLELVEFDKIIIGASIRYGKHSEAITQFISENQDLLDAKPNAFFSVNVVARKLEKSRPETNPYLIKYLKKITWKPKNLAVFAGKIDYSKYTFFDRIMIQLIMWMTKGPTDPKTVIEYTNWQNVDLFSQKILTL
jgi:menaquinone-dependent protoporphyrinogen oxidase